MNKPSSEDLDRHAEEEAARIATAGPGWTPGPWWFYELPHDDGLHMGYIRPDPEDGLEISHHGDMGRSGAENLANGHLQAAAPDLYEALERMERLVTELYPGHVEPAPEHVGEYQAVSAAVMEARAALKKARNL